MSNKADLQKLHGRLLDDDPIAPAEFAEGALDPLIVRLKQKWPALADEHQVIDAATNAILTVIKKPDKYDPEKSSLEGYLLMIADRDLKNNWAKQKRQAKRESPLEIVELASLPRNKSHEDAVISRRRVEQLIPELRKAFPASRDQQLLKLLVDGVRQTPEYARVLGVTHLPIEEQRREVKKAKDRIKKRLARLGEYLA